MNAVFFWSLVALALALLATAFVVTNFGRRITKRISDVSGALKSFAEGDRGAKLTVS
ncbi:MAG: hypothetical protein KAH44_16130 [Oricola sp.]|nr:hypothetical protein [Oricola sp.]